jgi:hypothetical protein
VQGLTLLLDALPSEAIGLVLEGEGDGLGLGGEFIFTMNVIDGGCSSHRHTNWSGGSLF